MLTTYLLTEQRRAATLLRHTLAALMLLPATVSAQTTPAPTAPSKPPLSTPQRKLAATPPLMQKSVAQTRAATSAAQRRAAPREKLPPVSEDTLLRIMRAEDERRFDVTDLGSLLSDASAGVRRRAALAAGRIGDEAAIAPLSTLLRGDASEAVRAMAAFALGEIESGAGADALVQSLGASKSNEVRARDLEALGKIAAALPQAERERQEALGTVILQTLAAEQKLPKPDRGVVLLGLTAVLRARPANAAPTLMLFLSTPDARVRADALNTLSRLRVKDFNERLRVLLAGDTDAVVRANAARALGAAEDAGAFDALLARALNDADLRVRVSSIRALGLLKDARAGAPLLARADTLLAAYREAKSKGASVPAEMNELLEISTTLGRVLTRSNDERAVAFLRALREASNLSAPEVEIALARVAPTLYVRGRPFDNLSNRNGAGATATASAALDWQGVSSVAQGLGEIAALTSEAGGNSIVSLQADAQMILRAFLSDTKTPPLAMPDVLRAVAAFKPLDQAEVMRSKLAAPDVIVRAAAADLLGELPPDVQNVRALSDALGVALQDEMNDAALSILDALAKQKSPEAFAAIRTALEVPDHLVRRRAAALLHDNTGEPQTRIETVATRNKLPDYRRAIARIGKRVLATVVTDKGQFVMEFVPEEAPLTVDNFVQLANKRYFDGVTFHRVVPNFVVQGGDPRGDGNGGPGYQIRCEINTVPYARGAVGMALSGKDTGGSQWFVTHSPQPHLDGGYTVFARVVEGMEVVDRIARGDRIRSIRITENAPAPKTRRP